MNATALHNEPMSRHTSWRVGGPADIYIQPESLGELSSFLQTLDADVPLHWVGLGSNLLVRDGGIRGAVISTIRALGDMERLDDGLVEAGAGVACTQLARRCARWQLGPAEFFAGIPGTVGGALNMNAGAFGGETWDNVATVDTIDRSGEIRRRSRDDYSVSYRHVDGPDGEWFVGARFAFEPQDADGLERVRNLLRERQEKTAARPAQLRFGVPQSARRFRGPADRGRGTEGLSHRRRTGFGEARELHYQHRRCQRIRCRAAHRPHTRNGRA